MALRGAVSGALLAASSFPIGATGLVSFVALAPLLGGIAAGAPVRRAAFGGWVCGVVFLGLGFAWVPFVGQGVVALWLAFAVGVPVVALVPAAFAAAVALLRRVDRTLALSAAPAIWVGLEFLRSRGELGIPWLHLGYSVADFPLLLQIAALGGVYLVSLWIVGVNAALVGMRRPLTPAGAALAALLALPLAYGGLALTRSVEGEALRVAAVQPKSPPLDRLEPAYIDSSLDRLLVLSRSTLDARPAVLIWPETAFPRPVGPRGDVFLSAVAHQLETPLLTGVRRIGTRGGDKVLFNSAMLLDARGRLAGAADKVRPVPLYERAPASSLSRLLARLRLWPGGVASGERPGILELERPGRSAVPVGVLVCIDASHPDLARDARRRGARLLVGISNESVTGAWTARQHALMSHLRAVETGVPFVRVANTGPTQWIDARGRSVAAMPLGERGARVATLPLSERTTGYARLGDGPVFAGAFAVPVASIGLRGLRRRHGARRTRSGAGASRG